MLEMGEGSEGSTSQPGRKGGMDVGLDGERMMMIEGDGDDSVGSIVVSPCVVVVTTVI